jgi:hypothetical protein
MWSPEFADTAERPCRSLLPPKSCRPQNFSVTIESTVDCCAAISRPTLLTHRNEYTFANMRHDRSDKSGSHMAGLCTHDTRISWSMSPEKSVSRFLGCVCQSFKLLDVVRRWCCRTEVIAEGKKWQPMLLICPRDTRNDLLRKLLPHKNNVNRSLPFPWTLPMPLKLLRSSQLRKSCHMETWERMLHKYICGLFSSSRKRTESNAVSPEISSVWIEFILISWMVDLRPNSSVVILFRVFSSRNQKKEEWNSALTWVTKAPSRT